MLGAESSTKQRSFGQAPVRDQLSYHHVPSIKSRAMIRLVLNSTSLSTYAVTWKDAIVRALVELGNSIYQLSGDSERASHQC